MINRAPALAALSLLALAACGPSSDAPAADGGSMSADSGASAAACAPIADTTPTVCSMNQPARNVIFTNNCADPVDIWWVNYMCGETFYHRLTPGTSYTQASFVTHPWRARTVPPGVPMGTAKGMLIKEFGPIPAGTTDLPFMVP
jgi:hypothetical protein